MGDFSAAAAKAVGIPQIELLQGASNYHTWRSMATTFLNIMGVWDVVSCKTVKPGDAGKADNEWLQQSHRAKGFLLLNVEKGIWPIITLADDAPDIWQKLKEAFDQKTTTTLYSLLKAIFMLRYMNKHD